MSDATICICLICTSGRGSGGLLYQFTAPWIGLVATDAIDDTECPQCGSSVGLRPLTADEPAALAALRELRDAYIQAERTLDEIRRTA